MATQSLKMAGGLISLALRPFIGEASSEIGKLISRGPSDNSQRLMLIMSESQDRGWRALEVGLRGSSWWNSAGNLFTGKRDDNSLQKQIGSYLKTLESSQENQALITKSFRENCLGELIEARKQGIIPGPKVPTERFPEHIKIFPAGASATQIKQAENMALGQINSSLVDIGFSDLAKYIALSPNGETPLLALAVQYFFRRAVENDHSLAQLLQVHQLEKIESQNNSLLEGLDSGFQSLGSRLDSVFDQISEQVTEVKSEIIIVQNTLNAMQMEEFRRQEASEKDRQFIIDMLKMMSSQIADLKANNRKNGDNKDLGDTQVKSNNNIDLLSPVNSSVLDDVDYITNLRTKAGEAIEKYKTSTNPDDSRKVQELDVLTQRFDAFQKRAFPNLSAPTSADKTGSTESFSSGTGMFKRKNTGFKRQSFTEGNCSSFIISVYNKLNSVVDCEFDIVNDVTRDTITAKTNSKGVLDIQNILPGSYKIVCRSFNFKYMTFCIRPGQNVLKDWDLNS
jgi:hypothetical protein